MYNLVDHVERHKLQNKLKQKKTASREMNLIELIDSDLTVKQNKSGVISTH